MTLETDRVLGGLEGHSKPPRRVVRSSALTDCRPDQAEYLRDTIGGTGLRRTLVTVDLVVALIALLVPVAGIAAQAVRPRYSNSAAFSNVAAVLRTTY